MSKGFNRLSVFLWGALVLFLRKKDGTIRMCIDFRQLKKVTVKKKYPLPHTYGIFYQFQGVSLFSKIDLRSDYHQLKIMASNSPKKTFHTRNYDIFAMSFNLNNTLAAFIELMNGVFRPYLKFFVIVFINNILMYSMN